MNSITISVITAAGQFNGNKYLQAYTPRKKPHSKHFQGGYGRRYPSAVATASESMELELLLLQLRLELKVKDVLHFLQVLLILMLLLLLLVPMYWSYCNHCIQSMVSLYYISTPLSISNAATITPLSSQVYRNQPSASTTVGTTGTGDSYTCREARTESQVELHFLQVLLRYWLLFHGTNAQ